MDGVGCRDPSVGPHARVTGLENPLTVPTGLGTKAEFYNIGLSATPCTSSTGTNLLVGEMAYLLGSTQLIWRISVAIANRLGVQLIYCPSCLFSLKAKDPLDMVRASGTHSWTPSGVASILRMSEPGETPCLLHNCSLLVDTLLIRLCPSEGIGHGLVPSNLESGFPHPADIKAGSAVVHSEMDMYALLILGEGLHCKGAH